MLLYNFLQKTFNEIVIQTPNDDTSKLEEALKTSKLIDWTRQIEVPFAPKHVMDCVRRINLDKKMKTDITRTETFVLDKDTPLFEDIR